MGRCIRRRSSSFTSLSLATARSRRVFRLSRKFPRRDLPHRNVKPRKLKVSGFPSPFVSRLAAAWRPNSIRRVRVERQRELLKPHTHCIEEATGVALMLEAGHQITGIAHYNHVAGSLVPSPALGPQIEDIVQVDVGK